MAVEQATENVEQVETQVDDNKQAESQEIDYKAEYENTQKLVEKLKADNAGLDRKIGELSNAQKELLKKTETAEETAERERLERAEQEEIKRKELVSLKAELEKRETDFNIRTKALENNFKAEEIEIFNFTSPEHTESVRAYLDSYKEKIVAETLSGIEKGFSGPRENINRNKSLSKSSSILDGGLDS